MKNKKFLAALVSIVLVVALSLIFASCSDTGGVNQSQAHQQQQNNTANDRLHKAEPYPVMTDSQELHNQREWYLRLNDPHKVAYIYLVTKNGSIFAEYQIIAKCSSTNSQYSAPATVVDGNAIISNGGSSTYNPQVVPAAQPDGSYGQNEQAVFCFLNDAKHTMIEFSESWDYLWSETQLNLTSAPVISVVPNGK